MNKETKAYLESLLIKHNVNQNSIDLDSSITDNTSALGYVSGLLIELDKDSAVALIKELMEALDVGDAW